MVDIWRIICNRQSQCILHTDKIRQLRYKRTEFNFHSFKIDIDQYGNGRNATKRKRKLDLFKFRNGILKLRH